MNVVGFTVTGAAVFLGDIKDDTEIADAVLEVNGLARVMLRIGGVTFVGNGVNADLGFCPDFIEELQYFDIYSRVALSEVRTSGVKTAAAGDFG